MHRFKLALAALAVLAVTASAALLGSTGGPSSADAATTAARKNIVGTAVTAGQFKTLVSLVKSAGLAGTLSGRGQFTVFAPTDAAFAKVPKETLDMLGQNRTQLRKVLLLHVVKGRYPASRVLKLKSVRTLAGQRLAIRVRGGNVYVGGARVAKANVRATNGIIHAIDRVLLP
jgi:uncharacterized surface protein with fasciclin (FAS1) repeats